MSYSWNVYKLFSNGNRAKAPFAIVGGQDCESDDFSAIVRKNLEEKFGAKARDIKYKIMRADLPQEERQDEEEKKHLDLRNKVFSLKIQELCITTNGKNIAGALLFSKDTNWKWEWCVARAASNQFIHSISPKFKSPEDAQRWMAQEIEKIVK